MGEGAQALLVGLPRSGETVAGKYVIERVLAVGGMGAVMAAHDQALDRRVAIKFMLPKALESAEVRARFLREARAAVAIRSEHVVDIYEVGVAAPDMPFIVMEYLPGRDLHRFLETRAGMVPVAEAADYVLQACEALAEAHTLGIVHRDVKPSNFFMTHRPDGSALIKVLDFGISKTTGLMRFEEQAKSLTQSSVALGSPLYMSPEQVRNSKVVDARTDIWSVGVVLYELLAKQLPFDGETVPSLAAAIASDKPRPLRDVRPDVPPELDAVVMRCLEKDPSKRYQTIAEFARAVQPFAGAGRHPISFDNIEANAGDLAFMSTTSQASPLSAAERAAMASGKVTIDADASTQTTTAGLGTTKRFVDKRRSGFMIVGLGAAAVATFAAGMIFTRQPDSIPNAGTVATPEPTAAAPAPVERVTDIEPSAKPAPLPPPALAPAPAPVASASASARVAPPSKVAAPIKRAPTKPVTPPPPKVVPKSEPSLPPELRGTR